MPTPVAVSDEERRRGSGRRGSRMRPASAGSRIAARSSATSRSSRATRSRRSCAGSAAGCVGAAGGRRSVRRRHAALGSAAPGRGRSARRSCSPQQLRRSAPPSGRGGAPGARQLALDQALERLLHVRQVGERVHPLAALLELARRLRAAQHQHAHDRLLGVAPSAAPRPAGGGTSRARLPAPLARRVKPRRSRRCSASRISPRRSRRPGRGWSTGCRPGAARSATAGRRRGSCAAFPAGSRARGSRSGSARARAPSALRSRAQGVSSHLRGYRARARPVARA